ncbi:ABC transporter permease [Haloarchaeobius iranensis]|uniref:Iron(III) transport system permease protein n=1 Tax=Haloarchaeobius iranensis TaxID=996166 RepID=A0A1G9TVE4_9EURY|nr:iron ABC transporter permease [Haloarchaeobius iranensis]SDM51750.1 iron(III) transport system permease protein [Haloarchaeobius iranensis]
MAVEQHDSETATDDEGTESGAYPLGLSLASAAVAAAVASPFIWVLLAASNVPFSRALEIVTRDTTVDMFVNSTIMVAGVTVFSILLGVPLAYLTVRTNLPGRRVWTVLVTLPLVIPSYIGAFVFTSAFGEGGDVNEFLAPFGVPQIPDVTGLEGAVLVITLYTYPYVYITARAGLKTVDTTLVDAARTLRHSRLQAVRRVVLPQLQPAIAAGALLTALYALSDFGTPAIMGYNVFTTVIESATQRGSSTGGSGLDRAALLSLQLLTVTAVILAVENRTRSNEQFASGRQGGQASLARLGPWKWPALALCSLVVLVSIVLPVLILVGWLLAGPEPGWRVPFELSNLTDSLTLSVAAAVVATIAGLPIAYLSANHDTRVGKLTERVSYFGYAAPGVVVAFALIYLSTRTFPSLNQALPLLIFAYVVRFLPQSVGSTRASFLQVNPALPEAARTLGRSSVGAFRSVTLPLAAPGLLGGAALVFLTTMKELPVTLLLRPTRYETLVIAVWQAHRAQAFYDAAVPALILLGVSAVSIFVILSQEGYDVK